MKQRGKEIKMADVLSLGWEGGGRCRSLSQAATMSNHGLPGGQTKQARNRRPSPRAGLARRSFFQPLLAFAGGRPGHRACSCFCAWFPDAWAREGARTGNDTR
jgi:hypothetical protein